MDIEGLLSDLYASDPIKREHADRLLSDYQSSETCCQESSQMLRSGRCSELVTQYCLGVLMQTVRDRKWRKRMDAEMTTSTLQHLTTIASIATTPTPIVRKILDLLVAIAVVSDFPDRWPTFLNWCMSYISSTDVSPSAVGWLIKAICLEMTSLSSPSGRHCQLQPAIKDFLTAAIPTIIKRFVSCGDSQLSDAIAQAIPMVEIDALCCQESMVLHVLSCPVSSLSALELQIKISNEIFELRTIQPESSTALLFLRCVECLLHDSMLQYPDCEGLIRCLQTLLENHIHRNSISPRTTEILKRSLSIVQFDPENESILDSYFSIVDCICEAMETSKSFETMKDVLLVVFTGIMEVYAPSVHAAEQEPTSWYDDTCGKGILVASRIASLFMTDFINSGVVISYMKHLTDELTGVGGSRRVEVVDCGLQLFASLAPDFLPIATSTGTKKLTTILFESVLSNKHVLDCPLLAFRSCGVASAYSPIIRKLNTDEQKYVLKIISNIATYVVSQRKTTLSVSAAADMTACYALKSPKIVSETPEYCSVLTATFEHIPVSIDCVGFFAAATRVLMFSGNASDLKRILSRILQNNNIGMEVLTEMLERVFQEVISLPEKTVLWGEGGLREGFLHLLNHSQPRSNIILLFQVISRYLSKQVGVTTTQQIASQLLSSSAQQDSGSKAALLELFTTLAKLPGSPHLSSILIFCEGFVFSGEATEVADAYLGLLMSTLEVNFSTGMVVNVLFPVIVSAFEPSSSISPSTLFTLCTWMLQIDLKYFVLSNNQNDVLSPLVTTLSIHILNRKMVSEVHSLVFMRILQKLPHVVFCDVMVRWVSSKVPPQAIDVVVCQPMPQEQTLTKFTATVDDVISTVKHQIT